MFESLLPPTTLAIHRARWIHTISAFLLLTVVFSYVSVAQAQPEEQQREVPKPASMTLETKDGVQLRCTWYAPTNGKKSVPFIMLHGWGGVRGDYSGIATALQKQGHAVIVPDLRGHGTSNQMKVGNLSREIDRDRGGKNLLAAMSNDIEAVKKFLMQKNNEGELNIGLLCVVAAEETSIVATNWAIQDWSWPQLTVGKQGQDVKALVLLSPVRSFKGASSMPALRHPLFNGRGPFTISVMIMVGDRSKTPLREANTIRSTLERTRPKVPDSLKGTERFRKKDLYFVTRDVELQGAKLLDPQFRLKLERQINGFVKYRLEDRADEANFRWSNRSRN